MQLADHTAAQSAGCAVDVLIANAGMLKNELLADSDPLAWWRTQEVNVRGAPCL